MKLCININVDSEFAHEAEQHLLYPFYFAKIRYPCDRLIAEQNILLQNVPPVERPASKMFYKVTLIFLHQLVN